ncbi:MAG: anti-phage dCTP deaminase [Bryobacteraceae bacterium]|jgi:deoxycytidylate deaminase
MAANPEIFKVTTEQGERRDSRAVIGEHASGELFLGVVGHAGSGTSEVATSLARLLEDGNLGGEPFDVEILKARDVIISWARKNGRAVPSSFDTIASVRELQNLGDAMRAAKTREGPPDFAVIARRLALRIRKTRAAKTNVSSEGIDPILPDGKRRAYILDSIRHQGEVEFLRRLYTDAFILVGVVCEEDRRRSRLGKKYSDAGDKAAESFMKRDSDADEKHGQHVSRAFHLADFFVDNTEDRLLRDQRPNPAWEINEHLSRLVKILTHVELVRPTVPETAMYHAYGAQMRSACLSRQVGAALVDATGNLIATGTNEVPKGGGGVYGQRFDDGSLDERCAYRVSGPRECTNTREQNRIIQELIQDVPELKALSANRKEALATELRKTRIGRLLEFSRAVHAEMNAVLSAARQAISPVGTRLFVTTFPCHNCARQLVAAGVDEVQYIEPYPKSQALLFHNDSIQLEAAEWKPPSRGGEKVWVHPFSGVAPHMYDRAFIKDRPLKNETTGAMEFGSPDWGTQWDVRRISYVQLEAQLAKEDADVE